MSSRFAPLGGGEFVVAFLQVQAQVDNLLFERDDALVEGVDVVGCAEAGRPPRTASTSRQDPRFPSPSGPVCQMDIKIFNLDNDDTDTRE